MMNQKHLDIHQRYSFESFAFKRTQNQRRLELGTTKYRNIIHKVNTETIKEIESTLSSFNSKTVNGDGES